MDKAQTEQALGIIHEIRVSLNRYEEHLIKELRISQRETVGYKISDIQMAKRVFIDAMKELGIDTEGSIFIEWCNDNIKEIQDGL
jgi:hypothetical protein